MVEQLSERAALSCPASGRIGATSAPVPESNIWYWGHREYSRLRAVNRIEGLVQEQADRPAVVDPRRAVLVEGRVVPQQRAEVDDDEHEAREGDQVGRHPHGEALDDHIRVEGLEDVPRHERVVDA